MGMARRGGQQGVSQHILTTRPPSRVHGHGTQRSNGLRYRGMSTPQPPAADLGQATGVSQHILTTRLPSREGNRGQSTYLDTEASKPSSWAWRAALEWITLSRHEHPATAGCRSDLLPARCKIVLASGFGGASLPAKPGFRTNCI
jgi:hypothetical protein